MEGAIEWLLASLFKHFPEEKGSIAAVAFNVKGPDLCYLDQPGRVEESDEVLYEKLGVEAKPFPSVEYFAPYTAKGLALNTFRNNEALLDNVTPLTWGLREVLQFAEVLLNKDDVDAKADALIDFIKENIVDKEFRDPVLTKTHKVQSFADLDAWFRDVLQGMEKKDGESLSRLRQSHEIQLQVMTQEVRFLQWKAAQEARQATVQALMGAAGGAATAARVAPVAFTMPAASTWSPAL